MSLGCIGGSNSGSNSTRGSNSSTRGSNRRHQGPRNTRFQCTLSLALGRGIHAHSRRRRRRSSSNNNSRAVGLGRLSAVRSTWRPSCRHYSSGSGSASSSGSSTCGRQQHQQQQQQQQQCACLTTTSSCSSLWIARRYQLCLSCPSLPLRNTTLNNRSNSSRSQGDGKVAAWWKGSWSSWWCLIY